ncbi:hypothetical protein AL542_00695 [Grimontia hollisae]|uniref:Uncharacterized protein n=2 Tax=Grimontia hollisae TaxID=673 RepID=D0I9R2_GRIHO|nr:hypothetical protein [Grimontia hollisae]AMG29001.1 hypothetical protein AL542_00695 [Grimontia hollisae]EEY71777.1 hypothetical protein VHA_002199 [Grimontia hollisae CIP 101886]MDF2184813.1 hypothetical protein [Grimontia hollisae]STO77091.1 Uncharacterised protein [Grimontia hollisae]STO98287.1 Uncharacterised protein [Grimontia hollisae]
MEQKEFETLVKALCQKADLPEALDMLKACENEAVAEAANALTGQFALAEVEGENRVYHVFTEENDDGETQEFVEHIMNVGDDVIVFVAWFFNTQFDIKNRDTYAAAGRTYKQPKRS